MAGSHFSSDVSSESSYRAAMDVDVEEENDTMIGVDTSLLTVQTDSPSCDGLSVQITDPNAGSNQTLSMDADNQTLTSRSVHPAIVDSNDRDPDDDLYGPIYTVPLIEANVKPSAVDVEMNSASLQGAAVPAINGNNTMPSLPPDLDLSHSVKGMYRILDLISEQGSGGLVDKIIIAQDSLQAFINTVSPGAYISLTKVDFKALDRLLVKPVGLYGSKEEIVRFLFSIKVVNESIAQELLVSDGNSEASRPTLRSGLYIIRSSMYPASIEQLYVVYWPEGSTWHDAASSSVRRNRVTFMRYLMKICDQISALISSDHAQSIVWNEDRDINTSLDVDSDETDRLFTFEVAKTNEQEESVTVRPGFRTKLQKIAVTEPPADRSIDPMVFIPRLLSGETVQGFITANFHAARLISEPFVSRTYSPLQISNILKNDALRINENLDAEALKCLIGKLGLNARFPDVCGKWEHERRAAYTTYEARIQAELTKITARLNSESEQLARAIHDELVGVLVKNFPSLDRNAFVCPPINNSEGEGNSDTKTHEPLSHFISLYSEIEELFTTSSRGSGLERIVTNELRDKKERIGLIDHLLCHYYKDCDETTREDLVKLALHENMDHVKNTLPVMSRTTGPEDKTKGTHWVSGFKQVLNSLLPGPVDRAGAEHAFKEARASALLISDSRFVSSLDEVASRLPILREEVAAIKLAVHSYFDKQLANLREKIAHAALHIQEEECKSQSRRHAACDEEKAQRDLRRELIREINQLSKSSAHKHTLCIDYIEDTGSYSFWGRSTSSYLVSGSSESLDEPALVFTIHLLNMTTQDCHNLQLDPAFIPSPLCRAAHTFRLPLGHKITHAQLLQGEKLLLVVVDSAGNLLIYLERLSMIDNAIERRRNKVFHQDKIGQEFILAFDESKNMLAVCASAKLHIFVFDDGRGSMQAVGSAINLAPWYSNDTIICQACFISGSEELLLVDSRAQARIFSLVTMQFRPASLHLYQIPTSVYSSPDGSCLLVSHAQDSQSSITAYHLGTFGSTEGILLDIPDLSVDDKLVLTSLVNRTSVHLLKLDVEARVCQSFALDITRKVTEFMFKERGNRAASNGNTSGTTHNCLIDCHAEVWTRFPVLPAVQRETISSSTKRFEKTLIFVTERDHHLYSPHFTEMIYTFERTTRKPTGDQLKSITVSAVPFAVFANELSGDSDWNISRFQGGEWLVDLLCLIPIHIAITKENRFVPLKDGVSSPELEKSLLGAEVSRIVDSLSFGWYESLFQSYMAFKPVKVVSSMGEQSVGKSFALNHLVDTSFAGSAMRTTEGVWMSVTPTKDALIVALDFEGVHSIERSAQEDTLLVLFNTAISNLVLFRNNFALSRDITGLFQSFQSSSTVLDPKANPMLFQSTLVIIIKDVVDSDKTEIAREFSLKFQKIVQEEQEANFITRLHAGKLNIIPWPVIESNEFYRLFSTVKKRLDQQSVTHSTAGEFLHTMKTLMAKLKANDWGAISQTMATHRAQVLLSILPNALAFGLSEVVPEPEPLKNLDTDVVVEAVDTASRFDLATGSIQQSQSRESALATLREAWDQFNSRQLLPDAEWADTLSLHLENLVDMRINHVREWVESNLSRFRSGHASIEELRRTFENATVDLKTRVQLCRIQCADCHLFCIQSRLHEGQHHCQSSHQCIHVCDFCDEPSGERKLCSMSAGHPGAHICVTSAHLCGEPCMHAGKRGCLDECSKVIGHTDEDHICAASIHACGEPCALSNIELASGETYSCPGTCRMPSDVYHSRHQCDARLCDISCQLCKRLCSNEDHFHGLDAGAVHLCGQDHPCTALCSVTGICEIDTAPYSIEATFTGRHETFQYTKYSQVAKRLKCIKPIPSGALTHNGSHNHSMDKNVVHLCETRCENCGYFCTLPLGHPQQEHETRHGSMSRTRWAVDGADDTSLEIEGRKFSANDEGAPMMCNLICQAMGRHIHIDYCRSEDPAACTGNEHIQHISERMVPNPDRHKDAVTHSLFWRRSGFKDPYSRDEQTNFTKCDAMCAGPEHTTAGGGPGQPSHCTLPLFHAPRNARSAPAGLGYVSNDGHLFSCKNPVVMQQNFHVMFVIDRSTSMSTRDRRPLPSTPVSNRIIRRSNNRLGAVISSLYSFWSARDAAVSGNQQAARRDAYSVALFDQSVVNVLVNDFTSSPNELLDAVLPYGTEWGTNFTAAIQHTQVVMEENWSTERTPVVIFLSDGECRIADQTIQDLCRTAVRLGKPLSFHAVSFGPDSSSAYLRRMADIALEVQNNAPRDPLAPAAATVLSSYSEALDTVQLAETFLGIAESLRKPRGSLLR
ncbi:hypothetical protein BJ138DRAFT_1127056 [Hygrophoropsis aurantiaca]|uniref:Uncharacterized protein n=1 Tax=Hygrophoropsis aurantiaca TaxID=72124 RepID=A0ACB8AAY0_9AGAM|nr:hypothetical protein BJ138DRAFT_1127056 [Hygrophoropsis aurantiaca]